MTGYTYSPKTRQYHDGKGKVVALAVILALRNAIADHARDEARAITAAYLARQATLAEWADAFAALIQDAVIAGYLLGRGGQNAVTAVDDARIAPILRYHLDAAKGFATALDGSDVTPMVDDNGDLIDPGTLSVDENGDVVDENGDPVTVNGVDVTEGDLAGMAGISGLLARAGSYEAAAIAGYSGGQSAAWGGAGLPEEPPIHDYCRCAVEYDTDTDGQIIANWYTAEDDRVCGRCWNMEEKYSDYPTGVYDGENAPAGDDGGE